MTMEFSGHTLIIGDKKARYLYAQKRLVEILKNNLDINIILFSSDKNYCNILPDILSKSMCIYSIGEGNKEPSFKTNLFKLSDDITAERWFINHWIDLISLYLTAFQNKNSKMCEWYSMAFTELIRLKNAANLIGPSLINIDDLKTAILQRFKNSLNVNAEKLLENIETNFNDSQVNQVLFSKEDSIIPINELFKDPTNYIINIDAKNARSIHALILHHLFVHRHQQFENREKYDSTFLIVFDDFDAYSSQVNAQNVGMETFECWLNEGRAYNMFAFCLSETENIPTPMIYNFVDKIKV